MATKLQPANPALFMEFPEGKGGSMEEMLGISKERAIAISDGVRDTMDSILPGGWFARDFMENLPDYVHAASIVCETPKELSFFMVKIGGFLEQMGAIYQDPEEKAQVENRMRSRKRPDVN